MSSQPKSVSGAKDSVPSTSQQKGFMDSVLFRDVKKLISIIDQMRDYGLDQEFSLPRIAVLGSQSSGKSSLIENIVGLDFLPRGSGVVTRRPLQLRLVHQDPRIATEKPFAVFENENDPKRGVKFTDFNEVRKHIEEVTEMVAGPGGKIVNNPIKLRVSSTECPDLTIIDLPGITRIDVKGQNDVFKVTTEMAQFYCSDPKTIILCVLPANIDLSTSEGLTFARQWDPSGERTIGCLTKIDIMDKGTSAKKVLMNQEIYLKLGYIGIVNRAQEDINNRVPVTKALESELKYFREHTEYRSLSPNVLGTQSLTKKLSEQLVNAIKRSLPDIVEQIDNKIDELDAKLSDLGQPPPSTDREKSNFLVKLISDYANQYKSVLSGKFSGKSDLDQVTKGALIKQKFRQLFSNFQSSYKCSVDYEDRQILMHVKSHEGDQISGFPSMEVFRSLLEPQLAKLKDPIMSLLQEVSMELTELGSDLSSRFFCRFPDVMAAAQQIVLNKLAELTAETLGLLETMMTAEIEAIFTNDDEYRRARTNLLTKASEQTDTPQKILIGEIRDRLDGYFLIVMKTVGDTVPKLIGYFLVRQSQDLLQLVLYDQLQSQSLYKSLGEPPEVEEMRRSLQSRITSLVKCQKALKKQTSVSLSE